jgi:pheromone alpha factor receptor
VLTVTCIFLPLSAIWAGVVNETAPATKGPDGHHRLIQSEFYRSAPTSTVGSSGSNTAMDKSRQMSVCTCTHGGESAATSPRKNAMAQDEEDLDIAREYSFKRESV